MIAIHTHQEVWFTMTYADISILIKNKINNKLVYWSFFCKKSYHHIFDLKLYSGVWQPAKKAWLLGEFVVIKRCMKRCNVDGNNLQIDEYFNNSTIKERNEHGITRY